MKIVSGGQTGVDRAALDVALELGLACGGHCPKGRCAEDGPIPDKYPLQETPSLDYAQRTEWNVRDSDGTLILTLGRPTGGTAFTIECARKHSRPCLVIDLSLPVETTGITAWLATNRIRTLNVAGPRASESPHIYGLARALMRDLLLNPSD
ncbi:MAG TPA: putative molybdenum carrier protein [Verrucomicrobiae bacterium]|nr:putative molybdenum carrier protein [Verrucomicrobiae bacterium]